MEVGLLTGCQDRHYAFGVAVALAARGVRVEVVGSDEIDSPEFQDSPNIRFMSYWAGRTADATFARKLGKALVYYLKLIRYGALSQPRILHILWNSRLEWLDRTVLML